MLNVTRSLLFVELAQVQQFASGRFSIALEQRYGKWYV